MIAIVDGMTLSADWRDRPTLYSTKSVKSQRDLRGAHEAQDTPSVITVLKVIVSLFPRVSKIYI